MLAVQAMAVLLLPLLAPSPIPGADDVPPTIIVATTPPAAEGGPVCVLAGGELTARISARPGREVIWQLAARTTSPPLVIAQGRLETDRTGRAGLKLTAPPVRVRTECTLLVRQGAAERNVPPGTPVAVSVLPADALAGARRRLAEAGIGVIDPSGQVQQGLRDQKVDFEDIASDLSRDYFTGGVVIVAGMDDATLLADITARFETRLAAGATLVVLSPPHDWTGMGVRVEPLANAVRARLTLDKDLSGGILTVEDMGMGPWTARLAGPAGGKYMAWLQSPDDRRMRRKSAVVAAWPVGRGRLCVALLDEVGPDRKAGVDNSAIARTLLDNLILWASQPSGPPHKRTEKPQ